MFGKKNGYDVFLGGTTNNSTWREVFLKELDLLDSELTCFNPVVENWTSESIKLENFVKDHAKYHLYVLTPLMIGVYSIAEMVESSILAKSHNKKVFFYIADTDGEGLEWSPKVRNSLSAVSNMLLSYGAIKADSLTDLAKKMDEDFRNRPISRAPSVSTSIIDNS